MGMGTHKKDHVRKEEIRDRHDEGRKHKQCEMCKRAVGMVWPCEAK